ncbi:MAG: B12-binding domain-containing radical SAM protein [Nanoarchaeota archaeon]|nr:B12-binding domain-containing radical SAM protein [Nanoarchaeota archaeon]
MKILLVNPQIPHNFYNDEFHLPSGVLAIGSVLKEAGENVKLLDLKVSQHKNPDVLTDVLDSEFAKTAHDYKPDLIGFGGLFSGNFLDVLRMSKLSKKNSPDTPIIMGGTHPTMYAKEILENCPSLDYLTLGEAESTVAGFIKILRQGKRDFSGLEGFAYRKKGLPTINERTKNFYIKDLDSLPFPAYELINFEDYDVDTSTWHNPKNLKIRTEIPISTSRSCPYDCNFCASSEIMGRGFRKRSANNVLDEIEYLYHEHQQTHFGIMDDNFTFDKQRLLDICNGINKRSLDIQFETHNGVSIKTLDDEIIEAMANAGLTRVALPIESGSDYIRNQIMRKELKREKIYEVVNTLKKYDSIFLRAFYVIGMPEETKETLQDTYNMIKELELDKVHLTNIIPFPMTRVYEQAKKDNLLRNVNPDELYLSDKMYQANFNTYFIKPYNMEIEELHEFRQKCEDMIKSKHTKP